VKKFSRPPQLSCKSYVNPDIQKTQTTIDTFKNVYIAERRVLERYRMGEVRLYEPAPSLDGVSNYDTPEESPKKNQWLLAYNKLEGNEKVKKFGSPTKFVRILFRALRGTSLSIPTVPQLACDKMIQLVADYMDKLKPEIISSFLSECERTSSAVVVQHKSANIPFLLAVYYAAIDSRLELSPLFRYCLVKNSLQGVDETDKHRIPLERLASKYQKLALWDYSLFPDIYDEVWKAVIPEDLRVAAKSFMASVI
jgi:hypothetical protein